MGHRKQNQKAIIPNKAALWAAREPESCFGHEYKPTRTGSFKSDQDAEVWQICNMRWE